jgi:hypothetical protein
MSANDGVECQVPGVEIKKHGFYSHKSKLKPNASVTMKKWGFFPNLFNA